MHRNVRVGLHPTECGSAYSFVDGEAEEVEEQQDEGEEEGKAGQRSHQPRLLRLALQRMRELHQQRVAKAILQAPQRRQYGCAAAVRTTPRVRVAAAAVASAAATTDTATAVVTAATSSWPASNTVDAGFGGYGGARTRRYRYSVVAARAFHLSPPAPRTNISCARNASGGSPLAAPTWR